ncbi:Opr family porin [Arcobacter porcinus]|uniref:Campylo_MOMP domain-containing protein n=1 Tax=Arcobacter porcinus TaxID=1935204 RepID=A0A5C2HIX3_9BACT|nr:Opr family porin [Arcobacter porcinus]OCL96880.1 hypothetical protein AAX27_00514 [Aliarcobacter thereius]QEP40710.1 Campylo_MOMP domain-containing protein [Arcobacter porcinus]
MKKFNLSLIAVLAISSASVIHASTLQEALKDGKVSGEVTLTTEERYFKKDIDSYYRDSAYGVGSFALKYETGVWNNLSLTSKTRAYKTIWEKSRTKPTGTGTGDATGRFYEKDGVKQTVDIESLFLEYTPNSNINVKAGRQDLNSDWMNKIHDAVKIEANFKNTSIEAIWSIRDGRVHARDYRPLEKMNGNKGVYKLGINQKFNENISATAYGLVFPDSKEIYGAKVNLAYDDTKARIHYAYSDEGKSLDKNSVKDVKSDIIDIMFSTSLFGFSPYLGYAKVSDDLAFPGYNTNEKSRESGEIIVPFEEGDYFYSRGASTIYAGIGKTIGDFNATFLYGNTKYYKDPKGQDNKKNTVDEATLWLGYKITSDLKSNLGYTYVNEKDTNIGEYNQVNLTFTYSF